jgi:hypothetical protein
MRPFTRALNVAHSHRLNSIIMSGIDPKQNAFKFKITPHKQTSIVNIILFLSRSNYLHIERKLHLNSLSFPLNLLDRLQFSVVREVTRIAKTNLRIKSVNYNTTIDKTKILTILPFQKYN